jgi:hypothetical protein
LCFPFMFSLLWCWVLASIMAKPSCFCTCNRKSMPKEVITLVSIDPLKGVDEHSCDRYVSCTSYYWWSLN